MELARSTSRGGFFVRSIFTFALTVLAAVLLWMVFAAQTAHAEEPSATWNGDSLSYEGQPYYVMPAAKSGESHGLAEDTKYYVYVETISERPLVQKAHMIYFPTGTDPPTATTARYVVYDYQGRDKYANPSGQKEITVTPNTADHVATQCAVDGIGWMICPISVHLADAMDWLFNEVLSDLMAVQPPITGNTNNDLYVAWNVMRTIANIAFIIVFIIIIYSQMTNFGVDNYGIKKLLPRLLIGALLVNLSYYICAIFVDISNISGYALQDLLVNMRNALFYVDSGPMDSQTVTWDMVTTFALSGGAVGALGVAAAGSAISGVYLIIPLLLALLLTVLFVLAVLAARQAIIIILIVIAPLAFVAYLLPNTEKWFQRWRELFATMLIFFPAFSVVFAGAQLAGGIIIQNATTFIMLIFGLAVQVAPLVITPLLLKLSGGILGKIAGLVNNPRKGLMDRTRNWAGARQEMWRQRAMANKSGIPYLRRLNLFKIAARVGDRGDRDVKARTEAYSQINDNNYRRSGRYGRTHPLAYRANAQKQIIEKDREDEMSKKVLSSTKLYNEQLELANATNRAEASKTHLDRRIKDSQSTGYMPRNITANGTTRRLMQQGNEGLKQLAAQKAGMQAADLVIQKMIAESFNVRLKSDNSNLREWQASQALLKIAAGTDPNGVARAQAAATAAIDKLEKEARENIVNNFKANAVADNQVPDKLAESIVENFLTTGITGPQDQFFAAVEMVAEGGRVDLLRRMRSSGALSSDGQSKLSGILSRNGDKIREKGAGDLVGDLSLAGATQMRMDSSAAANFGSTTVEGFSKLNGQAFGDDVKNLPRIIANAFAEPDPEKQAKAVQGLKTAYFTLTRALNDDDAIKQLGRNLPTVIDMHKALHSDPRFTDPSKAIRPGRPGTRGGGGYDSIDPRV